jgi:hypothetical protein
MRLLVHFLALFLYISISGCELLCQAGTGTCGMSREEAQKLLHPKTYGEYWVKPEMSVLGRGQDSISCGGSDRGADFSFQQLSKVSQKEDKDEFSARTRLTKIWIECMRSKGYEFQR